MTFLEQLKDRRNHLYEKYRELSSLSTSELFRNDDVTDLLRYLQSEISELSARIAEEEKDIYNIDMIQNFVKNYPEDIFKMLDPHKMEQYLRKLKLEQIKKPSK